MDMAQESLARETAGRTQRNQRNQGKNLLGPILCWAVVFADIGTSVYYTPGILYQIPGIGSLAGFFVFLTMSVFVLLTLKYAEVTERFPQGGGVVTVAAQAMNHWVGALGGMFILVDYFLTAAISSLSGMQYLSVVIPALGRPTIVVPLYGSVQVLLLLITIVVLVLLGILNWIGISESAKVSLVGAVIAFASDIAILFTVFTHISFSEFLSLFPLMFANHTLTTATILVGFANSFLAFSGLESISQLSPVMRTPRKKVAGIALLLVVLTIGITSPLLTMLSTTLLPKNIVGDSILSGQVISLLAGHFGGLWGQFLQIEVAISASALLVFASNTAIIGTYHVFMALSRMEFFPAFILKRNRLRGTPHNSIALATFVPIIVLILVLGNIIILGDMYAFGLLGAFSLTCLGLDIVRHRERKAAKVIASHLPGNDNNRGSAPAGTVLDNAVELSHQYARSNGSTSEGGLEPEVIAALAVPAAKESLRVRLRRLWYTIDFWLGVLTTVLVITAWSTNLVNKHLATLFGGTVTLLGMAVAYYNYNLHKRKGRLLVVTTTVEKRLPESILAVFTPGNEHNSAVMRSAISNADGNPVVFLFVSDRKGGTIPRMFEVYDPYLEDRQAKELFGQAESLAKRAKINRQYVYRQQEPEAVSRVWHRVHPRDTVIAAEDAAQFEDVNPDRIRYELTPEGKVAHLLKRW
jgi:amino acid transporter